MVGLSRAVTVFCPKGHTLESRFKWRINRFFTSHMGCVKEINRSFFGPVVSLWGQPGRYHSVDISSLTTVCGGNLHENDEIGMVPSDFERFCEACKSLTEKDAPYSQSSNFDRREVRYYSGLFHSTFCLAQSCNWEDSDWNAPNSHRQYYYHKTKEIFAEIRRGPA